MHDFSDYCFGLLFRITVSECCFGILFRNAEGCNQFWIVHIRFQSAVVHPR
jgi:hypothetical protein